MRRASRQLPICLAFGVVTLVIAITLVAQWGAPSALALQPAVTPTPVVAGLPAGVDVVTSADLDLAAGNYRWQATIRLASQPGDSPMTVHQGALLVPAGTVLVSHAEAAVDQVTDGRALAL